MIKLKEANNYQQFMYDEMLIQKVFMLMHMELEMLVISFFEIEKHFHLMEWLFVFSHSQKIRI